MLKLIVGLKGSGKTKTLIDMANARLDTTDGAVVCIEKGTKLIHEIKYKARLIDTEEYKINDAEELYGFVAGIYASNHDVTDIFIDSALKICNNSIEAFEAFMKAAVEFADVHKINLVVTSSMRPEDVPEDLKQYV